MTFTPSKLVILGIGDDGLAGLTDSARRMLEESDLILGAPSTLNLVAGLPGRKVVLQPEMPAAVLQVKEALAARKPVLVSNGDPLFYGIARYLCDRPDKATRASRHRLFGNPDEAFAQTRPKRGLITQEEVRAVALAQLDIRATSTVWDIGAGSGSVAIEAAQLAHLGMVYAIEPEPADVALTQANAEAFGVPNVSVVPGRAPEVLAGLPEPDAIFVGGTGRQAESVLSAAYHRLCPGGSLAINVATLEGLAAAYQTLKSLAGTVRVWSMGISRGVEQMERLRFEPVPPTFLLAVTKPETDD